MVSIRSGKPICALPRLSEVSPTLPLKHVQCWSDDGPLSTFQGRSSVTSFLHASLLQAIDGVVLLALCQHAVSHAFQHFRSSETQATCDSCFARQCICSVLSLHSGMSRAVHPQEFSKVSMHWHICQSGLPIPLFTFFFSFLFSKLHEYVRMMACMVWLANQREKRVKDKIRSVSNLFCCRYITHWVTFKTHGTRKIIYPATKTEREEQKERGRERIKEQLQSASKAMHCCCSHPVERV